jgi:hypothetical protein
MWAPTLPGAEHGTVNGMLPDFRFVLGAVLAITLLAVAGLGLVTSVQLVREAHMAPLEDTRSLAFAGHAEWNQFYDPDGARRFEGLAGKPEGPVAAARLETPAETSLIAPPAIGPVSPEERTAGIPAIRLDPAPGLADEKTLDKTLETDPPRADPPHLAETPAAVTIAAPAADAPDVPSAERVASAPATSPAADLREETRTRKQTPTEPQAAGDPVPDWAPPTPRARPKAHFHRRIARAHIRSIAPPSQQTWANAGYPPLWPGYDDQFTGATTKKSTGKLTGTLSNRPQ